MALNFPNGSRSDDTRRNLVRFWGRERALEVSCSRPHGIGLCLNRHREITWMPAKFLLPKNKTIVISNLLTKISYKLF
jgi:hypothetical protein